MLGPEILQESISCANHGHVLQKKKKKLETKAITNENKLKF